MSKKTFSLYLAKPDIDDFVDILSEGGHTRLADPGTTIAELPAFGEGGRLYIFASQPHTPKWLRDLSGHFVVGSRVQTQSAAALLAFRSEGRVFVATFAHGWNYVEPESIQGDFGLRVAINRLADTKVKRLDRANLASAIRDSATASFRRNFSAFGIDEALDHIRRLAGETHDDDDADSMSGATSLKISGNFDFDDLPELAAGALQSFQSTAYQRTAFQVMDVVYPISDARLIKDLDQSVVNDIIGHNDSFELGLPIEFQDQGIAFRFTGPGYRGEHPDLLLRHYTNALGEELAALTPEILKSHKIIAVIDEDGRPNPTWNIRKSLIGTLVHDESRYAINEGEWYRINDQFRTAIETQFIETVSEDWDERPRPLRRLYDGQNNGRFEREEDYLRDIAPNLNLVCLDQTDINIEEIARSGFEPCDLLDVERKRFIHVKKNSRRSSVLSHFFKQGSNSATNFNIFAASWRQLFDLVEQRTSRETRNRLEELHQGNMPWAVEFWIVDSRRADGAFNVPFFSKISLRDERRRLLSMGYQVRVRFIELQA
jgi:uncharacterized protein (TIGR04141 family)